MPAASRSPAGAMQWLGLSSQLSALCMHLAASRPCTCSRRSRLCLLALQQYPVTHLHPRMSLDGTIAPGQQWHLTCQRSPHLSVHPIAQTDQFVSFCHSAGSVQAILDAWCCSLARCWPAAVCTACWRAPTSTPPDSALAAACCLGEVHPVVVSSNCWRQLQ
jgi:hypothetical protein